MSATQSKTTSVESQLRLIDAFRKNVSQSFPQDAKFVIDAVPYLFPAELTFEIRCDVVFAELPDIMLLSVGKLLNLIQKVNDKTLAFSCFGRLKDGEFAGIYRADVEMCGDTIKTSFEANQNVKPAFAPISDIKYVIGVLSYIQQPTIYADLIEVDEFTQKSRKKHGKRPLPPYRIIRPGQTIVRHRPADDRCHEGTGTGTPKCGHWRRDTKYVRKDGRIIYRRGCAVKGGPGDTRPVQVLPPNPVEWSN
ncbi:hypothetical protein H261_22198 [Paramagnetospirillum caucaseum]|uniref:Uncharacterized protein n=1 Tax=Paramagnetospirillum caucaseum TaxID=1244869 RepID=M2Z095_9PROT|nr:hypothetical protein [Paramagnetospirillum caucaseum]EME67695.1 hypothetical protein H261_22198 [Paramagnetospirillum caucaseum]